MYYIVWTARSLGKSCSILLVFTPKPEINKMFGIQSILGRETRTSYTSILIFAKWFFYHVFGIKRDLLDQKYHGVLIYWLDP